MAWLKTRDIKDSVVTNSKLGSRFLHVKKFTYDFAVAGGGAGVFTLTDDQGNAATLPDNAVLLSCTVEVVTPVTSGGAATLQFGVTGTAGLFTAALAKAGFDADGKCVAGTAAVPAKTTAAVSVIMTIATADLTAGKLNAWIRYYEGD